MANTPVIEPADAFKRIVTPKSGQPASGGYLRALDAQQRFLAASWKYGCYVSTIDGKSSGVTDTILNSGDKDSWLVRIPPFTAFVKIHALANTDSANSGEIFVQRVGMDISATVNDGYVNQIDVSSDVVAYYATDSFLHNSDNEPGAHVYLKNNKSGSANTPDGDWVTARFDIWLNDVELFGIVFEPLRANGSDISW